MFEDIKQHVTDWKDEEADHGLSAHSCCNKEAFDSAGLIYGMGHAVYSLSDPRAKYLQAALSESLSEEKGRQEEYELYANGGAPGPAGHRRGAARSTRASAANVDFYSGFVYSMLDLPLELYTPIFAIARIAGWSAHRMEELISGGKIIRPAYMSGAAPPGLPPGLNKKTYRFL